jgi:beta-phosphoglucomutase
MKTPTRKGFALLFDMDGVIADTNPTHKEIIKTFCDKHGKSFTEDFLVEKVYGRTNKEWIPELFGSISEEELNSYADEKERMFRGGYKDKLEPVKGLNIFLQQMKAKGIKMVVATSAPKENADFILRNLDIEHYFESILDSSHVDKGKPHPEVYLKASATIQSDPENCIVLEDSLAGVKAGLDAGCKVIGITTTHSKEELSNCHLIIDDFMDVDYEKLRRLMG